MEVKPKDLIEILNDIRDTFNRLPNTDPFRVNILTVAPDSWNIRQFSKVFYTSYKMAHKAKILKASQRIFASPIKSPGKSFPEATVEILVLFYKSDVNSRILTIVKDTVTVKIFEKKGRSKKDYYLMILRTCMFFLRNSFQNIRLD